MATTLPDILYNVAGKFPEHGIGYVQPDRTVIFESYPELIKHACIVLNGLHHASIKKGDIIILSLDRSDEIIPALWACFIGGIIPALLQPPVSFTDYNPAAIKAEKVFLQLNAPKVILSHKHLEGWKSSHIAPELLIDYSSLNDGSVPGKDLPELSGDDLALIQFSSGSTGDPKGVMLTHRNILCNIGDISHGIALGSEDVLANWMPLFHDMGLFGFHITPTLEGCTQYFVDPSDFVKDPFLWLDVLSMKKVTITGCPNFGQMLVNRFLNRRPGREWDFSSLRVLFNGAEPISVPIMTEFLDRLKPLGLDPASMFPCYGMAECTLAVTFPPVSTEAQVFAFDRGQLLKDGKAVIAKDSSQGFIELVNVGRHLEHCRVRIMDENEHPVSEGTIGNIQVRGENVTAGYYNDPEITAASFSGDWFRTGDLGFLQQGDLFITGRTKDIIFINGINYYAHDLENLSAQIPEVMYGKIVMAGYFDELEGRDKVLVFLVGAPNENTKAVFGKIREMFASAMGLGLDTFIPVKSSDIPRTSSGKIQRYRMVNRFLRGEFPVIVKFD